MAPGHRGSEIDPTTSKLFNPRGVVALPSTLVPNQTPSNPRPPAGIDVHLALEIVQTPSMDDARDDELTIAELLAKHPGYEQAFKDLCAERPVLFDDLAIARQELAQATGALNPFDGLRAPDEYLEGCVDTALRALLEALLARRARTRSVDLLAQWHAGEPKPAHLVAA